MAGVTNTFLLMPLPPPPFTDALKRSAAHFMDEDEDKKDLIYYFKIYHKVITCLSVLPIERGKKSTKVLKLVIEC